MLSLALLGVISLILGVIYAGIQEHRRKRVPPGTRPLPGPKGTEIQSFLSTGVLINVLDDD